MKTYKQISFCKVASLLTLVAQGVASVTGYDLTISDMIHSLDDLASKGFAGLKEPYFFAIRKMGTESGSMKHCIERCKMLGYPLVIAKVEADKVCDYNVTITYTCNWREGDNASMIMEFYSL